MGEAWPRRKIWPVGGGGGGVGPAPQVIVEVSVTAGKPRVSTVPVIVKAPSLGQLSWYVNVRVVPAATLGPKRPRRVEGGSRPMKSAPWSTSVSPLKFSFTEMAGRATLEVTVSLTVKGWPTLACEGAWRVIAIWALSAWAPTLTLKLKLRRP